MVAYSEVKRKNAEANVAVRSTPAQTEGRGLKRQAPLAGDTGVDVDMPGDEK